jgi:hypothetical protein
VSGPRAELLERIALLWRGDWSAHMFDGKDGHRWIITALKGTEPELVNLAQELENIEKSYYL